MNDRHALYKALRYAVVLLGSLGLSACVDVRDGSFQQVSGRLLDSGAIDALEKKKASIDEVIQVLGVPQERVKKDAVTEIFIYNSVRARTSYQSVLGVKHSESTQTVSDRWQLVFVSGRLSEARHSSELR
jgi:hypothetical protein